MKAEVNASRCKRIEDSLESQNMKREHQPNAERLTDYKRRATIELLWVVMLFVLVYFAEERLYESTFRPDVRRAGRAVAVGSGRTLIM